CRMRPARTGRRRALRTRRARVRRSRRRGRWGRAETRGCGRPYAPTGYPAPGRQMPLLTRFSRVAVEQLADRRVAVRAVEGAVQPGRPDLGGALLQAGAAVLR